MLLSMCHASKGHLSLCVIFIGVSVLVCHASKDYGGNFHLTLCVRVSFSLVCPCGGVSCFKMLWYNYSYSVCPCVIFMGVSVWQCVMLQNAKI